jgi:hypothetical protein
VTASPSGGVATLGANGHMTSKQSLDVATAGGRYVGSSNRGVLGQLRIEQATTGADGGYIDFDTCANGSTSPTNRMRIDSSGNVGIGTSSPTSPNDATSFLHIGNATNQDTSIVLQDAVETWEIYQNDDLSFLFDTTNVMTLQRLTGNVGIGTSSPQATFDCQDTSSLVASISGYSVASSASRVASGSLRIGNGGGSTGLLLDYYDGGQTVATLRNQYVASTDSELSIESPHITFNTGTSFTERMRIDSSGNVLVGTTAVDPAGNNTAGMSVGTGGGLSVQGTNTALVIGVPSAQTYGMAFRYQGNLAGRIGIEANNITVADTSDYRLKENVAPLSDALTKIKALKPSLYNFINDPDNKTHEGFIAHELQEVIPYAVSGEKDALITEATKDRGTVGEIDPQAVDLRKLVPTLVAAIQEQQTLIESLTARIAALEE